MSQTRRTRPSGSWTRPERFNLRLDAQTWARTNRLFARFQAVHKFEHRADAWESIMLPMLEKAADLGNYPKERERDLEGQMLFDFDGRAAQ